MGDFGLSYASGVDGAPDYTEVSYGIGPVGVSYGQYDDYGDNFGISYGFSCGSYDCALTYSDFSDDGYGADERCICILSISELIISMKLVSAIIKPFKLQEVREALS